MDLISREAAVTAIKTIRESIDVSRDPRDSPDGWVGNYGIRLGLSMAFREVKFLPSPWVSVKDRLPENGSICLVCGKKGSMRTARYCRSGELDEWIVNGKNCWPTHWMPLPEPPVD